MTSVLLAAAMTGLVGSLHCAGMCGPLVIAGSTDGARVRARPLAGYLLGRFASYATVGAALGALGEHALCALPVGTVQTAALLLVAGLAAWQAVRAFRPPARLVAIGAPTASLFARLVPRRGLGLGLATGVLPCGMLVAGWLLAASSGSAPRGALVMLAFAAASAPGLLVPALALALASGRAARLPAWAHGVCWLLLAAWIAARPLLAAAHAH